MFELSPLKTQIHNLQLLHAYMHFSKQLETITNENYFRKDRDPKFTPVQAVNELLHTNPVNNFIIDHNTYVYTCIYIHIRT